MLLLGLVHEDQRALGPPRSQALMVLLQGYLAHKKPRA